MSTFADVKLAMDDTHAALSRAIIRLGDAQRHYQQLDPNNDPEDGDFRNTLNLLRDEADAIPQWLQGLLKNLEDV